MKTKDLIRSAIGNTFRAKARTALTVLAIFVGAFTLTLTSGLGTGINRYIDDTVAAMGADGVLSVTAASENEPLGDDSGPREYDPDATTGGMPGSTVTLMTNDDLSKIADVEGIDEVAAVKPVTLDYVQYEDGERYVASMGELVPDQTLQLSGGVMPDDETEDHQVVIPVDYLEALKFDSVDDAVGTVLKIVVTDANYDQHTVEAEVVGVAEPTLGGPGGSSFLGNDALTTKLYDEQSLGLPDDQRDRWAQATAWFDEDLTEQEIDDLKDRLTDAGFTGTTVSDQLGAFTTVIDTIVLILNGFAVIALVAAGFGIVNTLLMSVQDRTREIGLMKAMGMSSGRVFTLFSLEAAFIGFLGSAIGVVVAMVVGSTASSVLGNAFLADLPGLTLVAFDGFTVVRTVLLIMFVAFLAGTVPAARAARKDPVEALRYE